MSTDTVTLSSRPCPGPKHKGARHVVFTVPAEAIARYRAGAYIQDAFPMLSVDDRERLISGYCKECWDALFGDEPE